MYPAPHSSLGSAARKPRRRTAAAGFPPAGAACAAAGCCTRPLPLGASLAATFPLTTFDQQRLADAPLPWGAGPRNARAFLPAGPAVRGRRHCHPPLSTGRTPKTHALRRARPRACCQAAGAGFAPLHYTLTQSYSWPAPVLRRRCKPRALCEPSRRRGAWVCLADAGEAAIF